MYKRTTTGVESVIALNIHLLADVGERENRQIDYNGMIISVHGAFDLEQHLEPPHDGFLYVTPCVMRIKDGKVSWAISLGGTYCGAHFEDEEEFHKDLALLRLAQ